MNGVLIPVDLGAGVVAGFTGAGLDLATTTGQSQLAAGLGRTVVVADQVHGTQLTWVDRWPASHVSTSGQADALATRLPGVALAIRTADCVPVLLANSDSQLVIAIHAGWRGVLNGIVPQVLERLADTPGAGQIGLLRAAIGPAICGHCYAVSAELVERFAAEGMKAVRTRSGATGLDLPGLVADQLAGAGVNRVERIERCTLEDHGLYSFRRQGAAAGRQCGVVMLDGDRANRGF